MITFIVRRLIAAVGLLLIVALSTFIIFFIIPQWGGQTPSSMAGEYIGRQMNPQALAAVMQRYGFNQPVLVHFYDYVKDIFTGTTYNDGVNNIKCPAPCLGYSFRTYNQVWPTVINDFPVTLSIALGAGFFWLVFGVFSGVISAVHKGSLVDRVTMFVALLGVAMPVYFVAPLTMLVLVYKWPIFPNPTGLSYVPFTQNPFDWAQHLLLVWLVLAFGYAALYTRLTRAGMLDALGEDYVRTARAKGVSERRVVYKHALRAAITPIVTIFGMDFGSVLGGAVLAEIAFSQKGIGALAILAIQQKDFPTMMGITLVAAGFIVIANLVVDVLYAVIDPRVRTS
ncbi:MAG TPA: ABC transporter permease [Actinocrinis sp.]|nr:ABC transporter permease [Actinocrinis sp.]